MREAFRGEMAAIGESLVEMTHLVGFAMSRATTSLLEADIDLAESVIEHDRMIDKRRDEMDERIVDLLARQQPVVATDLRVLVTSLRMSDDLERMGDLALHVAKVARMRHPRPAIPTEFISTILEMNYVAQMIVTRAGEVIASRNVNAALELDRNDDEMDLLHRKVFTMLLAKDSPYDTETAIDITLLSRYYERYADHAVSVARRVVYLATGEWPEPQSDLTGNFPAITGEH
ncbi:MAG TPA: phosphate signaling complex protein PhoU [Sporichthyaceae bacterium]|jgi:phosphate transport system protein